MNHEWVLDVSAYYEAGMYDDIDDWRYYTCKNCNIGGSYDCNIGEIYSIFDNDLTCKEIIIKNILE